MKESTFLTVSGLTIDFGREAILQKAEASLAEPVRGIGDVACKASPGGRNDYFSQADYWWPDPEKPDGLPFIRRDGESYPDAFFEHRTIMRGMRTAVANLAAAYSITGQAKYAERAGEHLQAFFIDPARRMNPSLVYAQAISGVCTGRGIGIIDTLHLVDVPYAAMALRKALPFNTFAPVRDWFMKYLDWMTTHPYGIDERTNGNNHAVCYYVQTAAFARFVGNETWITESASAAVDMMAEQMAPDGSFPKELARTKPYGYSIFTLDNLITLFHLVRDRLPMTHTLPDGRCLQRGIDFLYPYLADKSSWPYSKDVQRFGVWPAPVSSMLFAAAGLGEKRMLDLWMTLSESKDEEVRRNTGIRQPILFF